MFGPSCEFMFCASPNRSVHQVTAFRESLAWQNEIKSHWKFDEWIVHCAIAQLGCRNVVGNYHVLWYGKCLPMESIMASAMIITCFSNQTQNMIKHKARPNHCSRARMKLNCWYGCTLLKCEGLLSCPSGGRRWAAKASQPHICSCR